MNTLEKMNKGKLHQNFYTAGHNNEQQKVNANFKNYVRIDGSAISGYSGMGSSFNTGITLISDTGQAGMPSAEWYMLISAGGEGTRCQLAIALFTGKMYWRNCAAGKWSEWVQKI